MRLLARVAVLVSLAVPVQAAEIRKGDAVVVGPSEVIADDLYAFGGTIRVEGVVRGDLLAFGQRVFVPGRVEGDVIAAASELDLDGAVGGSVRVAGGRLNIRAKQIGHDVVVAGGETTLGPDTTVRKDLLAAGTKLHIASPVAGTVHAAANELELDAPVGGDADLRAEKLAVGSKGAVGGVLRYSSAEPANLSPQAQLARVEQEPGATRIPPALAFLVGWVRLAIGLFALGLIFRLLAPRWSLAARTALRQEPGRSVAFGAVALAGVPIAALMLFLLGALLGGWWLGLVVLSALGIAMALAFPLVGMLAGEWIAHKAGKHEARLGASLVLGIVTLALLLKVPILGAVLAVVTLLFGLGALLLGGWNLRRVPAAA
ncbi:MAG: polymer-forming cytoskeletal protein [Myxococcales bacterium]